MTPAQESSCPNDFSVCVCGFCCFCFVVLFLWHEYVYILIFESGKVRCSLKFNYRPQSMIKIDGFWKLCCMQFFPFLFLFKRKINNIILLAFFSWLSSLRLISFSSSLNSFLPSLSYFLKDSGLLPVIIMLNPLALSQDVDIHEARMDGFSCLLLTYCLLCSWWEGEGKLFCHPDFANVLWSLIVGRAGSY